jgi:serine/threonine protein kinase
MAPQSLTMYVSIADAGRGAHADAHFCLPKRTNLDQPSRQLDNLLSELRVVKQARVHGHRSNAAEIAALQTIQRQNFVGELPFFHLVERDTANIIPRWLATTTLPLCYDLGSLSGCYKYMPEKFTWLMFVQLYQALNFLHDTCQISHGDLYQKNVVIGYPSSNDRGLPQVKVIDFGVAESFATSKSVAWLRTKDIGMLIYLINIVIHNLPQSRYQVDEILEIRLRVQAERITHFNRFGGTIQG